MSLNVSQEENVVKIEILPFAGRIERFSFEIALIGFGGLQLVRTSEERRDVAMKFGVSLGRTKSA